MSESPIYSPLESGSIRILTLRPGSARDPICCNLTPTPIVDASSSFVALSYVWGPEPEKHSEISIDDVPFLVRPNLYHALITLRKSNEQQRFWIDAICIDQKNLEEKSLQLPLMAQIYTLSSYVLIWLGENENDSVYVMDHIHSQDREKFREKRFLTGLCRILQRDWFKRTWIIQEFALNKASPQIVCGTGARVTWEEFEQAYSRDIQPSDLTDMEFAKLMQESFTNNSAIYFLRELRKSFHLNDQNQHFDGYNFPRALYAAMRCDVSDPRDKIYGVLGLINQKTRDEIIVDYNKTTAEVFHDAMVCMLVKEPNPGIYARFPISSFQLRKERSTPSWVLNFDPKVPDFTTYLEMFDFVPQPPPTIRPIHLLGQQLSVQGLLLDQVDDILEASYAFRTAMPDDLSIGGEYLQFRNLMLFLLDLDSLINNRIADRKDFTLAEPLWKTLLIMKSAAPAFQDDDDCDSKWRLLMDLAKAYNAISVDDMIQFFRLMAEKQDPHAATLSDPSPVSTNASLPTGLLHFLMTHPQLAFQLNSNMTTYRKTQPLSDSLRMVLCNHRSFFIGHNQCYGISNPGIKKGDHLALLFPDLYMPFILREKGNHFEMVGLVYLPPSVRRNAIERTVDEVREFVIV